MNALIKKDYLLGSSIRSLIVPDTHRHDAVIPGDDYIEDDASMDVHGWNVGRGILAQRRR